MKLTPPLATPPLLPSPFDSETSASAGAARGKRGIADARNRWPDGTLTVALDLGDQKSKALVIDVIREWAHNTPGLLFRIVSGKKGDIRISDDEGLHGNWSMIGSSARKIPQGQPTMHLDRTDDSKAFRQTALHEFGHALGLEHEHQHPEHDINWNKEAIYAQHEDKKNAYDNYFDLPTGAELLVTNYDSQSVMHYFITPDETKDGRSVPVNYSLSKGDKAFTRKLYTRGRFQGHD
ncbi:M12 family metallopeptidase [Pseudomonas poae]|nr:M12 family metallopeptidase [Pseudomonas poae]